MAPQPAAGCSICDLLKVNDDLIIGETRFWRVTLTADQAYLGRAYVTARTHVPTLGALSRKSWHELHAIVRAYEKACVEGLGAAHVTWMALMNNAYAAPEPVPHVHWHVRPRYARPVLVEGRWYVDEEFGSHHQRGLEIKPHASELAVIKYRLQQHFSIPE